jgi:hypothetical protein
VATSLLPKSVTKNVGVNCITQHNTDVPPSRIRAADHSSNISYPLVVAALRPAHPEGLLTQTGFSLPDEGRAAAQSPGLPKHFAQALHFARLPDRAVGGMTIFRKYRLGAPIGDLDA